MAQLFLSLWRALLWDWIFLPGTDLKSLLFTSWLCLFWFQNQQRVFCRLVNFQVPSLEPLCILFHILDPTHSTFRLQTTSTLPVPPSPASLPWVTAERHLHPQHLSCLSCESSIQDLKYHNRSHNVSETSSGSPQRKQGKCC